MARGIDVVLAGREMRLSATFAAAQSISEKVGDPLAIMREAQLEAMLSGIGQVYNPKWAFTVSNIPQIIFYGAKASGDKITLAEVQDLVMDAGVMEAREVAIEYIAIIATPSAVEKMEEGSGDAPGE